jgi:uncharacterized protein (DUF488 family)
MQPIFSIGHSNRSWNDFISLLLNNHVNILVDVRRYPGSRAYPQFNREEMAKQLKKEDITYVHIEKLGGRRRQLISAAGIRYNNNGWKNKSFKAYADYMITASFKEGINEMLSLLANYGNLVVMCSEVVPWRCHRRMIADYLTMIEGISVFDIIDNRQQPRFHKVTSFACLTGGDRNVIYPDYKLTNL